MGIINFRLRPRKDADLIAVFSTIPETTDRSDVIRCALRSFFGLSNTSVPDTGGNLRVANPESNQQHIHSVHEPRKKEKADEDLDVDLDGLLGGF